MIQFSYTKSPQLARKIAHIDRMRTELLLTPLSLKDLRRLQWKNTVKTIYSGLQLENIYIPSQTLQHILSFQTTRHLTNDEKLALHTKETYNKLYFEWYGIKEPITIAHVTDLLERGLGLDTEQQRLSEFSQALTYIQANPDHPLIQGALTEITAICTGLSASYAHIVGSLLNTMFLYKNTYDFRRIMCLNEYYVQNQSVYFMLHSKSIKETNVTEWMDFVLEGHIDQLQKVFKEIAALDYGERDEKNLFALNQRQIQIINLLEQPGSKISNRDLQKQFKISSITAARDLSKLAGLGLVYALGKGRSTYYTKA